MQSLELACEQLMGVTKRDPAGPDLKRALIAYKELTDSVKDETEILDRVSLMLRVIGQNLMPVLVDDDHGHIVSS